MSPTKTRPRGVHLVGSIGFADAAEVFRKTSELLPRRLRRVPDGETGARQAWIGWQSGGLKNAAGLELIPPAPGAELPAPKFKVADGFDAGDIELEFGYAAAAIASYDDFEMLKRQGVVDPGVRMQVSLPTPFAGAHVYALEGHRDELLGIYDRAIRAELAAMFRSIPHDQLAIQWDFCLEVGYWERPYPRFDDSEPTGESAQQAISARTAELVDFAPDDVEVGFHLCYGDNNHKHFVEPQDAAKLVDMCNRLTAASNHKIAWFHLPVPRDRDDAAYFEPLAGLDVRDAEIYLGLVHFTDGKEGTARRAETAGEFIDEFGVATECGMGRRPADHSLEDLLEIHRDVTEPLS